MSLANTVTVVTNPKVYPPLDIPNPSPKVRISDPDFEKLTTAEKLNDRNYRELVYQIYPDEPTCACKPEISFSIADCNGKTDVQKSPSNFLVCRSGCKRACCWSVRQPSIASSQQDNANKDEKVTPTRLIPTYCVGSPRGNEYDEDKRKTKVYNSGYCGIENRLRGGGEGGEGRGEEGMYPQSGEVNRAMVRSFDDARNGENGCVVNRRLEGGGRDGIGYEYIERYPLNRSQDSATITQCYMEENPPRENSRTKYMRQPQDSHLNMSHLRASPNACASATERFRPVAAGCCCPGKEMLARSARQRGNSGSCVKKPCSSVDCLIKTFRETQEFVESLGKVPGLAGLGLMDPAESPYFGRERTKHSNSETTKLSATVSVLTGLPNPQCVGPCNPQMLRSTMNGRGPYSGATSFTIAASGRDGVVREAVPSMPGPGLRYPPGKSRKRDDKDKMKEVDTSSVQPAEIETGPCGEVRCKAKRKKSMLEALPPVESSENPTKKTVTHANMNGGRFSRAVNKVKGGGKMRSGHRTSQPGPGGDRIGRRKSGRRAIRFVYSAGDSYSGFSSGHKGCIEERRRVPWNMGWLWNLNQTVGRLKPRVGWKPGAIARNINEILREAKVNFLLDHKSRPKTRSSASSHSRSRSAPSRGKNTKVDGDRRSVKKALTKNKEEEEDEPEPPPTLYIRRKDGTYYVTMYPIKQEIMDIPKLEEPMKPLQFKIAKNKDDLASVATSSTASDMEIEFSPPAAVNRYRKKPNVVHVDTQVKQQEIIDAFKNDDAKKKEKNKGKKGKK